MRTFPALKRNNWTPKAIPDTLGLPWFLNGGSVGEGLVGVVNASVAVDTNSSMMVVNGTTSQVPTPTSESTPILITSTGTVGAISDGKTSGARRAGLSRLAMIGEIGRAHV